MPVSTLNNNAANLLKTGLNNKTVHYQLHPAQLTEQTIIRQQGLEPDFVDYIGTKYKRLG